MGDVNLEIKLHNLDIRVEDLEQGGGGGGGQSYITSVSNDFRVYAKKLNLSSDNINKINSIDDKIEKPSTATNGQVLTYDNGNWVAEDSQGGTSYITSVSNDFNVASGELDLSSDNITKLSKLNNDGTINFSDVNNKPTTLNGYNITDAYTKNEINDKLDAWLGNVQSVSSTGEQTVIFTINPVKAYELWFETSNGSQITLKSSSLSGTLMSYVLNIPDDCPVPVYVTLRQIK